MEVKLAKEELTLKSCVNCLRTKRLVEITETCLELEDIGVLGEGISGFNHYLSKLDGKYHPVDELVILPVDAAKKIVNVYKIKPKCPFFDGAIIDQNSHIIQSLKCGYQTNVF